MSTEPKTLLEAMRYFADLDVATEFVAKLRWPSGPVCPDCGVMDYSYLKTRRVWKCKGCKKQYSVKKGTIFEDSPIGLDKWLAAIWMVSNCRNGISSHELGRSIGVTQKTGWFMLQRIRLAMQTGTFNKLGGEVEADETFIGGKARNMHKRDRVRKMGTNPKGYVGKTIVFGAMERGGNVRASVVPNIHRSTLHAQVRENVEDGSALYTDALTSYRGLGSDFAHEVVDHAETYVDGRVHTNGIENFWSLLKRGLHGTYISVEPFHLFRYLDEQVFRFNHRDEDDSMRFRRVLGTVADRRVTYATLTGKTA